MKGQLDIEALQKALLDAVFVKNGVQPDWLPKQLSGLFQTAVRNMRHSCTETSDWHENSEGGAAVWAQRIKQAMEKLEAK